MWAMVFDAPGRPLCRVRRPVPAPGPLDLLVRVEACGVCRTDLHLLDGDLPHPGHPVIPGHQIVGRVVETGSQTGAHWAVGDRVGIGWMAGTCGTCRACIDGHENLCPTATFTGYNIPGGYAEYAALPEPFCFALDGQADAAHLAPLLCAGLIGHRSLVRCGAARRIGLFGFGAAARLVTQVALHEGREVYAFTRPGDAAKQARATSLGVTWAGGSDVMPPVALDAAIIFAPSGRLVPLALKSVSPGGQVVCAGIHMSDIPSFPYSSLWGERSLCSVANLTRADGEQFLSLANKIPIRPQIETAPLEQATELMERLRQGNVDGSAVLVMSESSPADRSAAGDGTPPRDQVIPSPGEPSSRSI